MQQAFNFEFLLAGWDAQRFADAISNSLAAVAVVGAPSTWVLSNHDTVRQSTRFGLSDPTTLPKGISASDEQPNEQLGLARARAATAIKTALPGSAYVYQGDELGLPEHTTLAAEVRQDPAFTRTGGQEIGRDGCRVPLPWQAEKPGYGFSGGATAEPWLPQPESFGRYAANLQEGAPGSTLELYRQLLKLRRSEQLGLGSLLWGELNDPQNGVLSFENGRVTVLANFSQTAVELPAGKTVLLHSAQLHSAELHSAEATPGILAPNSTVWLH
ncbi:alpha-glucosidase [Renibacterium salmoninarum ATCC 33209]|uniref:Alpha-glucosidase n=1 Tax=Renibacterium salmoninarum (strain ATCC 33209 / DSM 20767 / JCM 11484 / NBRC 15589 / NCIMB 2235) TaxID=288705 RepID=A9WUD6_RENSM|nr:alpha-glucosidase [Renibacterium salmoninarum ATCC 33209]